MNYKTEYRRYKIAKALGKEINQEEHWVDLFNFVKTNITGLNQYTDNSNSIYYGACENDIIFSYAPYTNTILFRGTLFKFLHKTYSTDIVICSNFFIQIIEYHYKFEKPINVLFPHSFPYHYNLKPIK